MPLKKDDIRRKFFPLKKFAADGLYDVTYLSILVQRKKLKAKKAGRNYFTTIEWFEEYLDKNARYEKRIVYKKILNLISDAEERDDFSSQSLSCGQETVTERKQKQSKKQLLRDSIAKFILSEAEGLQNDSGKTKGYLSAPAYADRRAGYQTVRSRMTFVKTMALAAVFLVALIISLYFIIQPILEKVDYLISQDAEQGTVAGTSETYVEEE